MIQFDKVTKCYGSKMALQNINLDFPKGEMAFLTGHSGAGKSTLLRMLMMIEPCTRGQILFNGYNLSRLSNKQRAKLRRRVGMVFQDPKLLEGQTVFQNVAMPLIVSGEYGMSEIGKRARAALDKVGLLSKEKCLPATLSAGERQRVGIARAIVNKPYLIIADEPTGNLDPELSKEIMKLFAAFNNVGVNVIVATHDLPLIATMQKRIISLKEGSLLE